MGALKTRDGFTTGLGVLAATLGSAVGLGNIWKFPYLTGENGGAAFILVYIISTLLVGLPVMISEQMLGRRARANAIGTLQKLAPKRQPWWLIGVAGCLAAFLIMAFYTEVAGWVFAYIFKSLTGTILSTDPASTSAEFADMTGSPAQSLIWQWIFLIMIALIAIMGVSKGIERTTKRLMPILFVLLIIARAQPDARRRGRGPDFLLEPDFSKLTGEVVLVAMGLAFFSSRSAWAP